MAICKAQADGSTSFIFPAVQSYVRLYFIIFPACWEFDGDMRVHNLTLGHWNFTSAFCISQNSPQILFKFNYSALNKLHPARTCRHSVVLR